MFQEIGVHCIQICVVVAFAYIDLTTRFASLRFEVYILTVSIFYAVTDVATREIGKRSVVDSKSDTFGIFVAAIFGVVGV